MIKMQLRLKIVWGSIAGYMFLLIYIIITNVYLVTKLQKKYCGWRLLKNDIGNKYIRRKDK